MKIKKILRIAKFAGAAIAVVLAGLIFRSFQVHTDTLYGLRVTGNSDGGATVLYEDRSSNIKIQKFGPEGNLLWGNKGILLGNSHSSSYSFFDLKIAHSSNGGTTVEWPEVSMVPGLKVTFHVANLDSNGQVLSREAHDAPVPLQPADSQVGESPGPGETLTVSDGAGGAITSWRDFRNEKEFRSDIYAQRIDAQGHTMWMSGGVKVSLASPNPRISMVSSGDGGAIVAYGFQENGGNNKGLHVQKINADGKTVWPENGLVVTEGFFASQDIAPDGRGGVIIGRGVGKSFFSSEKAYIQRIGSDGQPIWGESGILLVP